MFADIMSYNSLCLIVFVVIFEGMLVKSLEFTYHKLASYSYLDTILAATVLWQQHTCNFQKIFICLEPMLEGPWSAT